MESVQNENFCAASSDMDTEMLHELIVGHTVACVLDRDGVSGHNDFEADAQRDTLTTD